MGEDIYTNGELLVTHYAGPAWEGIDRARWQFTTPHQTGLAVLRRDEVWRLVDLLLHDLADGGPRP